jgi:hypothetical protein
MRSRSRTTGQFVAAVRLSLRQRRYIKLVREGFVRGEAARRAGYSLEYSHVPGRIERHPLVEEALKDWLVEEELTGRQLGLSERVSDQELI